MSTRQSATILAVCVLGICRASLALEGSRADSILLNGQSQEVVAKTLEQLLDESKGGPYMEKKAIPTDPWDKPFTFAAPGSHNTHTFDLSCTSPKGTVVNNWE